MAYYEFTLIVGTRAFRFSQERTAPLDEQRSITVDLNGDVVGCVSFLGIYPPGFTVASEHILVWGGLDVNCLSFKTAVITYAQVGDVVFAAYHLHGAWFLVCETSVIVLRIDLSELNRYGHSEVILSHRWTGDTIRLMDFYGKEIVLQATATGVHGPGAS